MRHIILHTLSARFPLSFFSSGAKPLLAAGILDIENNNFCFFSPQDASSIPEVIKNASLLVTYNGTDTAFQILRKYYGLRGRTAQIPKKGKHIEIASEISKSGHRTSFSFEDAIRENLHEERLFSQTKIHQLDIDGLREACASDIRQIFDLYKIYLNGNLVCPKRKPRAPRPKTKTLAQLEKSAKLTIELVPKTSWFTNVRSQVSQKDWNTIRSQVYKNAQYKCQICGGVGENHPVECHEIWEYIDDQKIQRLKGFIALCPQCHEVKHIGMANVRGRGDIARAQLARVNQWSEKETRRYITNALMKWLGRSMANWSLDLGILDEMGIIYEKPPASTSPEQ